MKNFQSRFEKFQHTTQLNYIDAPCGSGKTYAALQNIAKNIHNTNYLYVSQTINLLKQASTDLKQMLSSSKHSIKAIHSGSTKAVGKTLQEAISNLGHPVGNVIFITWETYINLPSYFHIDNFSIIIDEIPPTDKAHFLDVPESGSYISDHIVISKKINETIGILKAKDYQSLLRILKTKSKNDDVYGIFKDLFEDILSQNKIVFVDLKSWNDVINRKRIGAKTLYCLSMLTPRALATPLGETNIILMGAHFENNMLKTWLENYYNVLCKPLSLPHRVDTTLAKRVRVTYYFSRKIWTKGLRDSKKDDTSYGEMMCQAYARELGDNPFLLVSNNEYRSRLDDLIGSKRIMVDSKGMNSYKGYTKLVHIAALNRNNKHISMLEQLGIDSDTIHQSTSLETLYQNVMRTALRDKESTDVVDVYVSTKGDADFLVHVFGAGVSVRCLGEELPEFKEYAPLTQPQKQANSRAKKVKENLISSSTNMDSEYSFTLSSSVKVKNIVENHRIYSFNDLATFISNMNALSKEIIKEKSENFLINPVTYIADEEGNFRRAENFHRSSMMVLDFDGGLLSPQDFIKIFNTNAMEVQKISFIICNSFSRSDGDPNCFRVFIPYSTPALTLDAHQAFFQSVANRLKDEYPDHTLDELGLDDTCSNGTQAFYPPCTNRNHPNSAFFEKFLCGKNDAKYLVDPNMYLTTLLKNAKSSLLTFSINDPIEVNQDLVIAAMDRYRSITLGKGLRNKGLFMCAKELQRLGLCPSETSSRLYQLAGSDNKIQKRIPGLLKSLWH